MLPLAIARQVESALRELRYGSVQLVIHDGQIVRIERVERIRLTESAEASSTISSQPTVSSGGSLHVQEE